MDAAVAGLLGAMIGSITTLGTSALGPWLQRRTEEARWKQSRADELWREERRALLELANLLAEGCQAAAWVSWAASVKTAEQLRRDVAEYDTRIRAILPKLFAAQVAAAGVSEGTFHRIDPLVMRLTTLDTSIGDITVRLDTDYDDAVRQLSGMKGAAFSLSREVVGQVSSYLRLDRPPDVHMGRGSRTVFPPG